MQNAKIYLKNGLIIDINAEYFDKLKGAFDAYYEGTVTHERVITMLTQSGDFVIDLESISAILIKKVQKICIDYVFF